MVTLTEEVVFLYGWGPEEEGRLSSLLYMTETAVAMDMKPVVFFFTEAVILARKGIFAKISEEARMRFREVQRSKTVKFYVCEEAARKRGITQENLEEDMAIVGYAAFLDMAISAKAVITI